jgi:hypothetical protein
VSMTHSKKPLILEKHASSQRSVFGATKTDDLVVQPVLVRNKLVLVPDCLTTKTHVDSITHREYHHVLLEINLVGLVYSVSIPQGCPSDFYLQIGGNRFEGVCSKDGILMFERLYRMTHYSLCHDVDNESKEDILGVDDPDAEEFYTQKCRYFPNEVTDKVYLVFKEPIEDLSKVSVVIETYEELRKTFHDRLGWVEAKVAF